MKQALTKQYYDSRLTNRGTKRQRIYTNRGITNTGQTGNCIMFEVRKEFNAQKTPIFNVDRIKKYKRKLNFDNAPQDFIDQEKQYLKAELFDFILDNCQII